jgi:hypothetical protein
VIPFLPAYIPPDVDMNKVKADVGDDGVSAPAADVAGLRQVVADARKEGIDLKIVVIETNPPIDTPLRDIATEVGQAYPGSTVLAISPSWAGTYSTSFDRVTLEAGQDFLSQLTTPDFPWTAFTIVLVLAVAAAAALVRMLQIRAKRYDATEMPQNHAD